MKMHFEEFDPVEVEDVERRGVWTVGPLFVAEPGDDAPRAVDGVFRVGHAPSGRVVFAGLRLTLGQAVKLMNTLADALPDFRADAQTGDVVSLETPEGGTACQAWADWYNEDRRQATPPAPPDAG